MTRWLTSVPNVSSVVRKATAFVIPDFERPLYQSDLDSLTSWVEASREARCERLFQAQGWRDWQSWEAEFWEETLATAALETSKGELDEVLQHASAGPLVSRVSIAIGKGVDMLRCAKDHEVMCIRARSAMEMMEWWNLTWRPMDAGWEEFLQRMQNYVAFVLLRRLCVLCVRSAAGIHKHPQLLLVLTDGERMAPVSRMIMLALQVIRPVTVMHDVNFSTMPLSPCQMEACHEAVRIFRDLQGDVTQLSEEKQKRLVMWHNSLAGIHTDKVVRQL